MVHVQREPVGPGQESVWDYPRPPRLESTDERVDVVLGGELIISTRAALRVLETSHPPTYYLPVTDVVPGVLRPASGHSFCEWKGDADYFDLVTPERRALRAAWGYPRPNRAYAGLLGHISFYPEAVDLVTVDDEPVTPQPGGFYGGWVTSRVAGPFKGGPGTQYW